jgi:hypothetical protein
LNDTTALCDRGDTRIRLVGSSAVVAVNTALSAEFELLTPSPKARTVILYVVFALKPEMLEPLVNGE